MRHARLLTILSPKGDTTAPTCTISAVSAVNNVVAMQVVFSEAVTGFVVGDITISAGSLASFATTDNITFTVSWTLAAGANTMDVNAGVCTDAAGNNNTAAAQYAMTYLTLSPTVDTYVDQGTADTGHGSANILLAQLYSAGRVMRGLIKPDLSSVPACTFYSAILTLYGKGTGAIAAGNLHRVLAANSGWTEANATWNKADNPGTAWAGSVGCGTSGTDYAATVAGTYPGTAVAANAPRAITLNLAEMALLLAANNGILIKAIDEGTANTQDTHWSSDAASADVHPKLELVYHPS